MFMFTTNCGMQYKRLLAAVLLCPRNPDIILREAQIAQMDHLYQARAQKVHDLHLAKGKQ